MHIWQWLWNTVCRIQSILKFTVLVPHLKVIFLGTELQILTVEQICQDVKCLCFYMHIYACVHLHFLFFFYCGERDESRECRQALFNPCVYALPCHISANRRRNFKDGLEISPRVEPLNIPAVQTIVSRACPNWPNKRVGIFVILPWNGPSFEFWKYAFRWIIWFRGHLMSSGLTTMEKPKGTGCVILFSTLWWLQIIKLWIKG